MQKNQFMELKTSVAINRFSEASTADHSPNFSSMPDDNQKHGRPSLSSIIGQGPFKYYQPNIEEDSKEESSDNGDDWESVEDDVFDPAESIFGSEAR